MTIVRDKYRVLAQRVSVIRDVEVLAQAWKKAHSCIRRLVLETWDNQEQ